MYKEYEKYVEEWLKKECHAEGDSPLSWPKWMDKRFYSENPTESEWEELKKIYEKLAAIGKEIEDIRVELYQNRAHRNLNPEDWKDLDDNLFRIQGAIRFNSDGEGFGACQLKELC